MDKNLKNLEKLLNVLNQDAMTSSDFVASFEKIMKVFLAMKAGNEQKMSELDAMFKSKMAEMENSASSKSSEMTDEMKAMRKEVMSYCMTEMKKMYSEQDTAMNMLRDKLREVKDTLEVDEPKIVAEVLAQIKLPEQKDIILDTPDQIADKLESIEPEDKKLKIEAIRDLRKELDELRRLRTQTFGGGGGFSKIAMDLHLVDDETPSGTINGTNKDFTVANIPSPASSLKVYRGGARQRITEDYTFSGNTISFTSAPQVGEVILVDYRL